VAFNVAVATSNGKDIDLHFGKAESLHIYQVELDGSYSEVEVRNISAVSDDSSQAVGCGSGNGCGSGCGGGGCHPSGYLLDILEVIKDCKYILAFKVGNNIEKGLKRYNITAFSIDLSIDEAIQKIVTYENRLLKFKGGF
jgi:hypothetical protein